MTRYDRNAATAFSGAATVRAPLTGIVLVLEMTDNYQLILPMIITCLGATLVAQFLGGKPLYSSILARTLRKQEAQQAREAAEKTGKENTTNAVNT
nr:chloride channel protein [Serratia entomophila]